MRPTISKLLTTTGFQAVNLPAGESCQAYSLWMSDGSAFYVSSKADGSDAVLVTIGSGKGFPFTSQETIRPGGIVCYAKGTVADYLVGTITQ